ncbi:MAG: metallophosphoesterase [Atribacterota bacterium]|nr:metallophosphoesterase family protein [Candidatus Atribacteria bacterium]
MKILAVSDHVDPRVYSQFCKERFHDVDCIISCGDLPEHYLDFIASTLNVPLFFVHGNHDPSGGKKSIAGGLNLDEQVIFYKGIVLAGLEGSLWYNGNMHQYIQKEMYWKYLKMVPKLHWAKMRYGRYLDILITHSSPSGIHEGEDPVHKGFQTFNLILKKYQPCYHLHGHTHLYDQNQQYRDYVYQTTVINCYNYRVIDLGGDSHIRIPLLHSIQSGI